MPELPEVETVKLGLEQLVKGKTFSKMTLFWPKSFIPLPGVDLVGSRIVRASRRGKVLVIELEETPATALLIHLKMTGQLVYRSPSGEIFSGGHPIQSALGDLPDKSTRILWQFQDGSKLFFNDQRKFGWVKLVNDIPSEPFIAKLGPEPLEPDFTTQVLAAACTRRSRTSIKGVLLDQSVVAGVGNIYADESLYLAKIHPARLAGTLSDTEIKVLHKSILFVLGEAIKYGGTSFTNFVNILGFRGNYLEIAKVFRKENQPCVRCGSIIKKIRVAGRGTHFCPVCQPLKRGKHT